MRKNSFLAMTVMVVMAVMMRVSVWAVPLVINYQGMLTDDVGTPLNGSYEMGFYIYDAVNGGSSLWDETQTVTVTDGVYNVELGTITPLTASVFAQDDLYLEVVIETETMSPRQQITSVAYAMRAGDADTIDGLDSSELDQSGHLTDSGNPHSVTAAQTGAATVSDITWSNLSSKPIGFADDVDDTGITAETDPTVLSSVKDGISWLEVSDRPSGLDDGDDVGIATESDPQVGTNADNYVPRWNGSALVTGTIYDNGNIGIDQASPAHKLDVDGDINTSGAYRIGGATVFTADYPNTFLGTSAGQANTTGDHNTFVGAVAGVANTTGYYNTFVGSWAGYRNTAGIYNTFLGSFAGINNTTGNENTFVGRIAGYFNTTGYDNTFVGSQAGVNNTTGGGNSFIGAGTGFGNTTGYDNTFVGKFAGYFNTTGYDNTFVGQAAGRSNTEGENNTFVGNGAGFQNTTGNDNTFMGRSAGQNNTTGGNNTFVGTAAGESNTTGAGNSFIGIGAGYYNTIGYENTFVGSFAGEGNTTGNFNTFLGNSAGEDNTTGNFNTFMGRSAGEGNTTGHENTFVGTSSGYSNTTGYDNTFVGTSAGGSNTTGNGNVFLGRRSGSNEEGSNKLYIANSETDTPLIYGEFDTQIVRINGDFECTTLTETSDERLKSNVRQITDALDKLDHIRGVRFEWNEEAQSVGAKTGEQQIGVIAQEVEAVFPELVSTSKDDLKSLDYSKLTAVLIEAVKEQQLTIKEQQATIDKLATRLDELEGSKKAAIESLKDQFSHLQALVETTITQQMYPLDDKPFLSMNR